MTNGWRRKISSYLLLLPALLFFTYIMVLPMLEGFKLSFTSWDGIFAEKYVGLANYLRLFKEPGFYKSLQVTFIYTVIVLVAQNAAAIFLAVMLDRRFFGQTFFRALFFIPNLLSVVVVGLIFSYLFNLNFGSFNIILKHLGLNGLAGIDWLGDTRYALYVVAAVTVWQYAGLNMLIYLGALQQVPAELYESAAIDGVSLWQKFRHVTFPLIMPAVTINTLITMIGCLRIFDIVFVMTGGGPAQATQTIAISIYKDAFFGSNAGYASAESFVLLIMITAIAVIQAKYLRAKEVGL